LALRLRVFPLVLLLLLTGCSMTPERLAKTVEKKTAKLKGYYAELDAVVYSMDDEQRYTVRQWVQFPDRWRIEVDFAGEQQIFVCDGEQIWVHQVGIKEYYRFDAHRAGEIPSPFLLVGYLEEMIKAESFTLHGRQKKDHLNCYLISYSGPVSGESVTIYLEAKRLFPVSVETLQGKEVLNRLNCTHLVLNPTFEAELFNFEPEAGSEVSAHCLTRPLSLEEAKSEWPLPVYMPRYLPPGAKLFSITRSVEEGKEQLILIFDGISGFILVQKEKTNNPVHATPGLVEVNIGGYSGLYQKNRLEDLNTLWWSNETNDFILSGHIQLDEMLKIAESLEAE